jgi:hypothetical protein
MAESAARQGGENTLHRRGQPNFSRAAMSQALGLSSNPMGMSMARIATPLGLFLKMDGKSMSSTDVLIEGSSTLKLTHPPWQPSMPATNISRPTASS